MLHHRRLCKVCLIRIEPSRACPACLADSGSNWEPRGASCGGCRNLAVPVNYYTSQSDAGASESPQGRRRVMLFRLSGPASLSSLALGRNCLLRKQEEKPDRESCRAAAVTVAAAAAYENLTLECRFFWNSPRLSLRFVGRWTVAAVSIKTHLKWI